MIISQALNWITHPTYDHEGTPSTWALGLVFILCVAFLWSRIVKQVVE